MKKLILEKAGISEKDAESVCDLIQQIVRIDHPAIRGKIASLKMYFTRLTLKMDQEEGVYPRIYGLFSEISDELEKHMKNEESVLFPYLVAREKNATGEAVGSKAAPDGRGNDEPSVERMSGEHQLIGRKWREITAVFKGIPDLEKCELLTEARFLLDELEHSIREHELLEVEGIYRKSKEAKWMV